MVELDHNEAVAFLQKTGTTGGGSVYDHITNVISKIIEERPTNAVDLLETSLLVKRTTFDPKANTVLVQQESAKDAAQAVAAAGLYGNAEPPIDPETGEPVDVEAPNEYECEDVVGDSNLFESVGVGLGQNDMYNVMLMVKQLGEDPKKGVATVRFFGKFLGLYADSYVFETTLRDQPEEEEAKLAEGEVPPEVGNGANGYVYFVCNYVGGPFSKLPSVKPQHIKVARTLKRFLTGKLDSIVSTYPPFFGTEADFLRAQIARISCSSVLCPASFFNVGEEGEIEKNEEFEPIEPREMGIPTNWCHRYPHLKKQGRCQLHVREAPEGEEDTFELTEEEQEEGPEPLTSLENDAEINNGPAWSPIYSSSNENVKYQVAGVQSNLWPGAYAVASGKRFSNIYVGWGIKSTPFTPLPPPPTATEFDQTLMESTELPPKPSEVKPEEEEEA
ncbi:hypothetical protein BSKO_13961 [Bryopsis sp. KO-2023]|nr:hypothetical protein BSKO_13961 [Bryopsis sp. KO-2023]